MIFDAADGEPVPPQGPFDVAIAGAGVAGIILGLKLARAGHRVAVVDAGGSEISEASQSLYQAEATGTENLPFDLTRGRCLGGSSNLWSGWCRPLDAHDFSGGASPAWPITAADLSPYFDEALAVLGATRTTGADLALAGSEGELQTIRMLFSTPPARLGSRFINEIKSSTRLSVFLNAPVVGAGFDPSSGAVRQLRYRGGEGAAPGEIDARIFVLAMGAVENVRMLLIWNREHGDRIGNRSGLLGRRYMQHLHQDLGRLVPTGNARPASPPSGQTTPAYFSATAACLARTQVGAFRLYSREMDCTAVTRADGGIDAACTTVELDGRVLVTAEQAANSASRIFLSREEDSLRLPRAVVDWRLSDADTRTLRTAGDLLDRYLTRTGLGRLDINPAVVEGTSPVAGWTALPSAPGAAGHQMGGAAMSASAADGVVDADCRVWDTPNLYVAGAAVFPSFGHAPPTLTIAQMSLRLAAELGRRLVAA